MKVFDHPKFKESHKGYKIDNTHIDALVPNAIDIGEKFTSSMGSWIIAHDASLEPIIGKIVVKKVVIGNHVFLGLNSIVMPGVTIGDNVIIGAGSIVTKDIPSNSVAVGSPAKVICTIEEYLERSIKNHIVVDAVKEFTPNEFARFRKDWEDEYKNLNRLE